MGAQRLVASAVVLVLTGTPVAASACALWCPPGAVHAAADTAGDVITPDQSSDAAACAALHRHGAAATPADGAAVAHVARSASASADASSWMSPGAIVAAPIACCAVPAVDAVRVAATAAGPMLQAPAPPLARLGVPAVPPRVLHPPPVPRPAGVRAARLLVLRI
jgi:hypothetical protein